MDTVSSPPPSPRLRPASLAWVDALAATAGMEGEPHRLLAHVLQEQAGLTPEAPALLSARETFTFAGLGRRIGVYAAWAKAQGLQPGDCVALVMSNRPEYVAIWLGLSAVGVVTALINTNLTGPALSHCLALAKPAQVIAEAPFVAALNAMAEQLPARPRMWSHGCDADGFTRIDTSLPAHPLPLPGTVSLKDTALLIYTSGTTGLPKAARVSHARVLRWALWFKGLLGNTAADRMYNCLPLYHSVGGIVAVAATLVAGGSTVIAEKFSARRFWPDITRWNCTQFQYIGELCRYLLNSPEAVVERPHTLRLAVGNGLRAEVWEPFQKRFGIPQIFEFYASTEGSFSLFNAEGKPGAIGRVPPYLRHRFPTALVRLDEATGEPLRDSAGLCIAAAPGEPGEAIGRIAAGSDGSSTFDGYTDAGASARKLLHDVFAPGDVWFRSGDLMRCDAAGYYYFLDRLGDTFRWKGENVSTLEVEAALAGAPGVADVTVFGVTVPGHDGKAGMAVVQPAERFSRDAFLAHAQARLPAYAVPVFLRLGGGLAVTETFKHKKQDLARDGFDVSADTDRLFVRLAGEPDYTALDEAMREAIAAGRVRL